MSAAHKGHAGVVKMLLLNGSSASVHDDEVRLYLKGFIVCSVIIPAVIDNVEFVAPELRLASPQSAFAFAICHEH